MKKVLLTIALAALPAAAAAEDNRGASSWQPTLMDGAGKAPPTKMHRPPSYLPPLSGRDLQLTPKERQGVHYGRQWAGNADFPARGEDGSVVFLFAAMLAITPLGACAMLSANQSYVDDLRKADTSTIAATIAAMVADRVAPEDKPVVLVPLPFSQSGNPFAGELKSALEARGYRVVEEDAGENEVYRLRYLLTDYQDSYVLRVHLDETETTTVLSWGRNGQLLASTPLAVREDVR